MALERSGAITQRDLQFYLIPKQTIKVTCIKPGLFSNPAGAVIQVHLQLGQDMVRAAVAGARAATQLLRTSQGARVVWSSMVHKAAVCCSVLNGTRPIHRSWSALTAARFTAPQGPLCMGATLPGQVRSMSMSEVTPKEGTVTVTIIDPVTAKDGRQIQARIGASVLEIAQEHDLVRITSMLLLCVVQVLRGAILARIGTAA